MVSVSFINHTKLQMCMRADVHEHIFPECTPPSPRVILAERIIDVVPRLLIIKRCSLRMTYLRSLLYAIGLSPEALMALGFMVSHYILFIEKKNVVDGYYSKFEGWWLFALNNFSHYDSFSARHKYAHIRQRRPN